MRGFLFGTRSSLFPSDKVKFTKFQLWSMARLLVESEHNTVGLNHVLFNVFKGDSETLTALTRTQFARVLRRPRGNGNGEEERICAGSPVILEALRRLTKDPKLSAGMDLVVIKTNAETEQAKISAAQAELKEVAGLTGTDCLYATLPPELKSRTAFLLAQIAESHTKIEALEVKRKAAEAIVKGTVGA